MFRLLSLGSAPQVDVSTNTASANPTQPQPHESRYEAEASVAVPEALAELSLEAEVPEQAETDSENEHEAGVDALVGDPSPPASSASSAADHDFNTRPVRLSFPLLFYCLFSHCRLTLLLW